MRTKYLLKLMDDFEEDLVHELSKANPVNLSKDLFQACIITSDMCNHFTSLDHSRVEPQLQIRYLLRLVRENIKSDLAVWNKFLILLDRLGGVSDTLLDNLKKPVSEIKQEPTEQSELNRASKDAASGDTSMKEDIVLTSGDVSLLTELLVEISHKWEEIAISLGLQEHDRAEFRKDTNKIGLNKTITCWISADSTSTLKKLKHALNSKLVGENTVAQDLEKNFKEAKKQSEIAKKPKLSQKANYTSFRDTNFTPTISKISYHTEVADGKSTLLLVKASPRESVSYQWKKDGHPLPNSCTYSGVHDDILVVSHASQGTEGEYTCCVSKEGKEVCSNEITLTVIYQTDKKQLLILYSANNEISQDSWLPEVSVTFINLALIKSSKDHKHVCDYSVRGDADDIIAKKEKIEYKEAFGEYRSRELILLEGRPGSGKTTLVHKIIRDWTESEVLTKAKLVFLITLRDLNTDCRDETLSDLLRLFYSNDEKLKSIGSDIERINGEGVCFVIDGLDEYQPQNTKKSIIYKLLSRTYLHQAMIIVSSRPAATRSIKKEVLTKRIEVFGFSKEQIFEYIDNFPFNVLSASASTVQTKLKEYLLRNPNIFDMCYLPVHAAMICFLFEYENDRISYTQTKIYEQFTRMIIQRHLLRHNIELELNSLKELCGIHKKYFDDICRLAFNMTINSKQVISQQELSFQFSQCGSHGDDFSLGLLTIYRSYSFLHLTFQEFLAAYHIANLTSSQQMKIIQQYSRSTHMITVWTFYFGLGMFGLKMVKKMINNARTVTALRYGLESQQKVVCDELMKQERWSLRCSNILTPTDLQAIGYTIATTSEPITRLILGDCHSDGEDRLTNLLEQLSKKDVYTLKTLEISSSIRGNEMNMLVNVLKSATNLAVLEFKIKDNSPDDVKCLVDQVKAISGLCELTLHCSSPASSIKVLLSGLVDITVSNILKFSFEEVDAEGVVALGSGLELHTNTNNITDLDLTNSSIGLEGATGLANGLRHLTKIGTLHLSHNNIERECFNSLCNGLQYLTSLRHLDLSHNDITDVDASSLGHVLHHLTRLRNLDLSHTNIGIGMSHLVSGLQCLTNIRQLNLSHNNISSDGATSLAHTFQYLTNLSWLYLSHNNIGPDGMTSLASGLSHLTKLWWLDISHNNIGADGMSSLAGGLLHLTKLWRLDISHNNIDLEGAKTIITSLKGCHELSTAIINVEDENYIEDGIVVHGLVSPDNTTAIADLVTAAESEKQERILDLGFERIHIPRKGWFRRAFKKLKIFS